MEEQEDTDCMMSDCQHQEMVIFVVVVLCGYYVMLCCGCCGVWILCGVVWCGVVLWWIRYMLLHADPTITPSLCR